MEKNIKIIVIVLIAVVILFGIILGFTLAFKEYKINKAGLNDYYKKLAKRCPFISYVSGFNCCFETVVDISKHGRKAAEGNSCPQGYTPVAALCEGAVVFCEPQNQ